MLYLDNDEHPYGTWKDLKYILNVLNEGLPGVDITTLCVGTAASMASFILTGGTRGKRIGLPHSRMMIHQPEGGNQGQAAEIFEESIEVMRIRRQVAQIYSDRTNQSISTISHDMDRDWFMTATQAKEYGLIDEVAVA